MVTRDDTAANGLSLVEVLIALVIIAVTFVALTASQVTNLRVTRDSQLASQATQTANETLEVLTQRVLEDYATYRDCPGAGVCSGAEEDGQFNVTFSVSRDASYVLGGLVLVDVSVTGPATATVSHFVSCMDVSPPPTVLNPGVCAN